MREAVATTIIPSMIPSGVEAMGTGDTPIRHMGAFLVSETPIIMDIRVLITMGMG